MRDVARTDRDSENIAISPFRARLSLGILVLLTVLSYMDRSIIMLMVDPIKTSLHITDFQFSLLIGLAFAIFVGEVRHVSTLAD